MARHIKTFKTSLSYIGTKVLHNYMNHSSYKYTTSFSFQSFPSISNQQNPKKMDEVHWGRRSPPSWMVRPSIWASPHKAHKDHPNGADARPAQGDTKDAAPKQGCPKEGATVSFYRAETWEYYGNTMKILWFYRGVPGLSTNY